MIEKEKHKLEVLKRRQERDIQQVCYWCNDLLCLLAVCSAGLLRVQDELLHVVLLLRAIQKPLSILLLDMFRLAG